MNSVRIITIILLIKKINAVPAIFFIFITFPIIEVVSNLPLCFFITNPIFSRITPFFQKKKQ